MKVVIFGATGMVGQGVLRECLLDDAVDRVLSVGRHSTGLRHAKLTEKVQPNLFDLSDIERDLAGYDACFFCLGVSSVGMSEADYMRLTFDLTLAVAQLLLRLNPAMTFVYVSGLGADSSERGSAMWARVNGKTENALLRLPFKAAYMFRPGYIQPLHGIKSRTKLYRILYAVAGPLYPLWNRLFPKYVTTTELVGRAMIAVALQGAPNAIIETPEINAIAART